MDVLCLLAPGQGSQKPGMLAPWIEDPSARCHLDRWSDLTGLELRRLGTTAEADEITDTAITQPLVVAAALLAYARLSARHTLPSDTIVAGHSVGELAAAAIAGVISADEAVNLAAIRGSHMAAACALTPTTMAAVLGGDETAVLTRLDELGLVPANRNAAGQIVAAGPVDAIDTLITDPPERARTRKIAVAGAFHTSYMEPAQKAVAAAAADINPADPTLTLLSNSDGQPVTTGAEALKKIADQVTRPVRWDLCTGYMRDAAVASLIELPPAGTLVGIAKRELKGTPALALKTPADLEAINEFG